MGSNPITSLSAVTGLTALREIHANDLNSLFDIQPLLDNSGIGAGDWVNLTNTPADCAQVAILATRVERLDSDCQ